jgi:hypothetical protein
MEEEGMHILPIQNNKLLKQNKEGMQTQDNMSTEQQDAENGRRRETTATLSTEQAEQHATAIQQRRAAKSNISTAQQAATMNKEGSPERENT